MVLSDEKSRIKQFKQWKNIEIEWMKNLLKKMTNDEIFLWREKWDEKIFWKCYKRWKSMKLDEWNSFKDEIRGKWKDFCMSENRWIQFLEAILWLRNEGKTSLEP